MAPAAIRRPRSTASEEDAPNYYLDWAFDEMRKLVDTFPKSVNERFFVVRTALDLNLQRYAEHEVESALRQYGHDYGASQSALVIADLDGAVRAMVGGRDYGASQFNRAVDALRQPGSSFKPYVYATALANGSSSRNSIVVDSPVCIGNWCPHNYSGGYSGVDDADAGDHPLDQRHSGQAFDRARRRQSQARPRQDHPDRAQFRHLHAAARHAVAADRRRRGERARARRRLCDLPQSRQSGRAARRARSAHRHRRTGVALRSRRQAARAGDHARKSRST